MTRKIEEVWGERDEEPWEAAMRENAEQTMKEAAVWAARWPRHCHKCRGWGGFAFIETHGLPSGGEVLIDSCDAGETQRCHRCGAHGLDADGNGPCRECGWDYDDGMPECGV